MAKIILNIPDAKLERITDGVCKNLGYEETNKDPEGKDIPNPESKDQFVKRMIIQFLKDNVIVHERQKAKDEAGQGVEEEIKKIIIT